ncbi:MAG: AAA family ATPase, partial [Acidobacteria bacterium]|nr:AAA family ATPase [Acidobacteriota bacterium]
MLAAMEGEQQLNGFLDKAHTIVPPQRSGPTEAEATEPPGAYVASISVEGFRGVGPAVTLALRPGPGLTLIVGRNGSGKSSFAEGLEYLLTGRNYRWEKRPKVWVDGWDNLHHDSAALKADLLVENRGTVSVSRVWTSGDLASNQTKCVGPDKKAGSLQALGWTDALVTFRPFLSYNELGSLLEEGPSKLYDALSKVLGLEDLVGVQTLLANARKSRQGMVDAADDGAEEIKLLLDAVEAGADHDRVERARKALTSKVWDLSALKKLVQGSESREASQIDLLRKLESIDAIDEKGITAAVKALRASARSR